MLYTLGCYKNNYTTNIRASGIDATHAARGNYTRAENVTKGSFADNKSVRYAIEPSNSKK